MSYLHSFLMAAIAPLATAHAEAGGAEVIVLAEATEWGDIGDEEWGEPGALEWGDGDALEWDEAEDDVEPPEPLYIPPPVYGYGFPIGETEAGEERVETTRETADETNGAQRAPRATAPPATGEQQEASAQVEARQEETPRRRAYVKRGERSFLYAPEKAETSPEDPWDPYRPPSNAGWRDNRELGMDLPRGKQYEEGWDPAPRREERTETRN